MSTDWGLRCLTCGNDSPTWFCNITEPMQEFDENWSSVQAIEKTTWLEIRIGCESNEEPTLSEFMHAHHDHRLVFLNEYGDTMPIPGRCTEMMPNGEVCGEWRHEQPIVLVESVASGEAAVWTKTRTMNALACRSHGHKSSRPSGTERGWVEPLADGVVHEARIQDGAVTGEGSWPIDFEIREARIQDGAVTSDGSWPVDRKQWVEPLPSHRVPPPIELADLFQWAQGGFRRSYSLSDGYGYDKAMTRVETHEEMKDGTSIHQVWFLRSDGSMLPKSLKIKTTDNEPMTEGGGDGNIR